MEFEISEILDSKIDKHHFPSVVKWSGYEGTDEETSWIPASKLKHTMESMADFHLMNPDKTRPFIFLSHSILFLKTQDIFVIHDMFIFVTDFSPLTLLPLPSPPTLQPLTPPLLLVFPCPLVTCWCWGSNHKSQDCAEVNLYGIAARCIETVVDKKIVI